MMDSRGSIRIGSMPARILVAILVLNCSYFLLFTFAHCDRIPQRRERGLSRAAADISRQSNQSIRPVDTTTTTTTLTAQAKDRAAPTSADDKISGPAKVGLLQKTISGRSGESMLASAFGNIAQARTKRAAQTRTRVQLARRPPKSTTTTTTTTSTTTTTTAAAPTSSEAESSGGPTEEEEEESGAEPGGSDDYVEIRQPKATTQKPAAVETEPAEEEAAYEDEEEARPTTTTTTTTTTRRPPTRKSGQRKSRVRGKADEAGKKAAKEAKGRDREPATETSTAAAKEVGAEVNQTSAQHPHQHHHHLKRRPLVSLPFIKPKNVSVCTPEAYLEFPRDFIGDKWRSRGLVIIHVLVVCYMFYSLALVCERYFMPSLEEFAQRLQISEDVAGATLMSAGSSAPELFTAILGVFVAKGDVGTGAIVGSAVFNILFVIGVCAFVSSTSAQLQWWPVLRDSVYYTFTVLVLIVMIYDERITALESGLMILLYGLYITIMVYNEQLKAYVTGCLLNYPITAKLISTSSIQIDGPDDVFGGGGGSTASSFRQQYEMGALKTVEDDSIFMAALLVIVKHKRLFRANLRFQSAARYIIIKRQHRMQQQRSHTQEVNYFGPEEGADGVRRSHSSTQRAKMEAYARTTTMSKQKFSIVSKDDYEFWHRPPEQGESYLLWLARIPVNYLLHYTIPDCTLYPDKYVVTFVASIVWTAVFSYLMVWMVTLIGYTLGIPDSVMGVTFLAAGTSVPDCYSSIHAARNGMADMAVSNSIGSNVFDILIGLSVPWFIQSAIYPGVVATINSRGVIYSVILLFLSLVVTIYLLNKYEWSLQPRLGLALLIAYGLFIVLTCMLEFNMFGHVNPPPCPPPAGAP